MPGVERRASRHARGPLVLACVLTACSGGPEAGATRLAAPAAVARTAAFVGSPLSGPSSAPPPWLTLERCDPDAAWRVEVEWYAVRSAPGLGLDPVVRWTRLVVSDPDVTATFGPSLLAPGAALGRVPDAEDLLCTFRARSDARLLATQVGALPPGVTARFELTEAGLVGGSSAAHEATPAHIALLLHRPAATVVDAPASTTLEASARRAAPGPAAAAALGGVPGALSSGRPAPAAAPSFVARRAGGADLVTLALDLAGRAPGEDPCKPGPLRRELLVLDEVLEPTGEALVLVSPAPMLGPGPFPALLVAVARVREAPVPGDPGRAAHLEAVAATLTSVQEACAAIPARPATSDGRALAALSLEAARLALRDPREQRRALLELAAAAEAKLLGMFALTGEHELIGPIARRLADRLAEPDAPRSGPQLRWLLERTVVDVVRRVYPAQDTTPALESILGRYAGAVAQRAAFLELFDAASSVEELEELLARENASLLDDPSAGIRARAAEWLSRQRPDLLPAGYDPLGSARERQVALARLRRAWPEDDAEVRSDDEQEDDDR